MRDVEDLNILWLYKSQENSWFSYSFIFKNTEHLQWKCERRTIYD